MTHTMEWFVYEMECIQMKDLLKYTAMGYGEQSAVIHSLNMLLIQCVGNWVMLDRKLLVGTYNVLKLIIIFHYCPM